MLKKLALVFYVFQICFCAYLQADDTYWDRRLVRLYVHNSELQRRWALAFLASNLQQLNGNEKILDIGCGDGKITAELSHLVMDGNVLGVDLSSEMLRLAQIKFHDRDANCLAPPAQIRTCSITAYGPHLG